jgi:hypothetical protein
VGGYRREDDGAMKRSPPPGDDSFPMPQKTRVRFPAESSEEKGGFARPNLFQLLRLTSTAWFLGCGPSHAPRGARIPGRSGIPHRRGRPTRAILARPELKPGAQDVGSALSVRFLRPVRRCLVISAGSLWPRQRPHQVVRGAVPYQTTGLVSLAPAQAYGSNLPDLRPQRSAWKGSPCFKTP